MTAVLRLVAGRQAALAVTLGALAVLSGAALLAASGALISGAALQPTTLLVLMPLITSVRLFGLSRAVLRYAERLVAHDLTLRLVCRVRARLITHLVPLAPAALVGRRGGDLLARVRADVDELQGVFVRLVAPTAVAVLAGGVAVGLTAVVSPVLALVLAALLLVLGVAVPAWARGAGRVAAVEARRADAAWGSDLLDVVRGLADHLSGDGGTTALRTLDAHGAVQERAERTAADVAATTTFLREAVPGAGLVAALWLVGWDVSRGATDPVLLAAAALGVLGSFEAVAGLGAAWASAEGLRAAGDRVEALGRLRPAVTDPPAPLPRPAGATLTMDRVAFAYPGGGPVLTGLDLVVDPGEKVALVGPSGAGKSTVLMLALRVRDPDRGRVLLGGTDLRDLALDDVRATYAWEPQEPQILSGTLAGNLRLSRDDAPDAELEALLHTLGLGDVLATVGLDGWIGESGERLSAGERARVGVARALLGPAPVLLLDEPTAHLDAAAARRVVDALAREERTVVMVTHGTRHLDGRWRVVELAAGGDGPARRPTGPRDPSAPPPG